jgi:hypothetical protein
MRIPAGHRLRMWVSTGHRGEGHDDEGGKGETQRLFHGNSPFSGANVRKMSPSS